MATAEQDVDEQEFNDFVAASQTLFAMVRRSRGRLANQAAGLSLSRLSLLEPVAVHGPLMVGQIAAYAGVAGPSATRMLKQLEAKGVVSRQRSTEDERKVLVVLTPRGEELVVRHRSAVRAAQRDHFGKLMPQQRKVFVEVLNQMAAMVDAWAGVDPSERPVAANR